MRLLNKKNMKKLDTYGLKDKQKSKKDSVLVNIYFSRPNIIQRFLYWIGILKDKRYNGEKFDWMKIDEEGQM